MVGGPRSAIIIVSLALLRLHVSVDRIGDGRIGAACFVLVDDRGALAVVAHPRHQVSESHAAPGRPRVPRVPEIMEMQAFRADRPHGRVQATAVTTDLAEITAALSNTA